MIHTLFIADDGNVIHELDEEAITYLVAGLEELRESEPGEELTTAVLVSDADTGEAEGVAEYVLRRAANEETPG